MSTFIDADAILSEHEQWRHLEQQWGTPVDLDTEDDAPKTTSAYSTLDLLKTTFDSSFLLKNVRKKVGRQLSKKSLDYKDFLQDLNKAARNTPEKQFYFISGQILSAASVDDICDDIDDIFRSVTNLCSATSTVRVKGNQKPSLPKVVGCSFSASGLSFDDTRVDASEKEKGDSDNVDIYIDEMFDYLNATLKSLVSDHLDASLKESVTTLVRKFTSVLKNPKLKCSPRKRRECCDRFRDLVDFWKNGFGRSQELINN